jgi:hypothetical protein
MSVRRFVALLSIGFSVVAAASPARADEKTECVVAHTSAQKLRHAGRFASARIELARCTRAGCPAPVRADCAAYAQELESLQPSIELDVRDASGRPTLDGTYSFDESIEPHALTPLAVPVDPGKHVVHVTLAGGASRAIELVVLEGEKRLPVALSFVSTAPGPSPRSTAAERTARRPIPATAWILGAFGVSALATGGVFGALALSDSAALHDACGGTHACATSDIDAVERKAAIADVAIGIGVVAVVAGVIVVLTRGREPAPR